ncbi:hypothetical protein J3L18_02905 [Mucilaginibacter gossypii]|uniref:hypothetical protein n=1 Tax=Mucilaginibacter gossypii TaxID=551996 RepID=UPI000DCF528C|nr:MULTISPECIES: hypothetical protein [Mucilaginibacter]QTE38038.1 hypothetical protein J3L18_02905 [Mucilaginibacter gossypii]RAV58643.1 hypothetical protein DIU36_09210 [Mucilaginibacter rubeus]
MPKRKVLKKPLFYFEPLTPWDSIAVWIYGIATIVFAVYNYYGTSSNRVAFLIFYTLTPQVFNYLLNYKSLRNLKSFLIWCGFALVHIILFFFLKNDPVYYRARNPLLNSILLLFLYQLLRIASRKIQSKELAMPSKDFKDLFDNGDVVFWDFIFFLIYWGSLVSLTLLALGKI